MAKVVVLGGTGGVGSVAVRALATVSDFSEVVIADARALGADALIAEAGRTPRDGGGPVTMTFRPVDANDATSVQSAIADADVVLNCIGPFYKYGPPILEAAISMGKPYVDVCDDLEPTVRMLEMSGMAKGRGVSALVGMGNSPGLANVFVRLCADMLLDQVEDVDIMHIHGGEPEEGPAVVKHRIFAMMNDIPLFLNGKMSYVRQLEKSGEDVVVKTDFRGVGTFPVYPYPHPETITLPKSIPGLKRATNMGVIFPLSYFELTQQMVRVGACETTPLKVGDREVVPLEFSVAHILSQRARLLRDANVTGPGGCLKVVVSGQKAGKRETFIFSLSSGTAGAGEGTGIPAAVGAVLMQRGLIKEKGVFAPENGVPPMEVLPLAMLMAKRLRVTTGDGVHVERIDSDGNRMTIPLGA